MIAAGYQFYTNLPVTGTDCKLHLRPTKEGCVVSVIFFCLIMAVGIHLVLTAEGSEEKITAYLVLVCAPFSVIVIHLVAECCVKSVEESPVSLCALPPFCIQNLARLESGSQHTSNSTVFCGVTKGATARFAMLRNFLFCLWSTTFLMK